MPDMNITFNDRTVIITGAAHGFGRSMAQAFTARGAHVVALDVNAEGLAETQRLCGPSCQTAEVDVGDRDAVQAAVAAIAGKRSGIDILVNNAGGVRGQRVAQLKRFRRRTGRISLTSTCPALSSWRKPWPRL